MSSQLSLVLEAPERHRPVRMAAQPSAAPIDAELAVGITEVTYMTITDVEIAFVGMEWPASTGPTTLTLQHLADAVTAANDDPHVLPPRQKIGHTDPRFNEDPPVHDPFKYHGPLREDGTPVYGRYMNLRLVNDGASLRGDLVECPHWLADAMPSAYPTRSLEGDWDVKTAGGKTYSFVLTAVAVGGEWQPAITCLEDLVRTLYSGPAAKKPVAARSEPMPVSAAASIDAVIHTFWSDFAVGDRFWWWPVDVWIEPNQVICDDDEGHLYRVPFTTDADGQVSFAEPVRVMQEFRDLPAVAASMEGELVARFAAASQARPVDRVRAAKPTKEARMTAIAPAAVLERLGLPEDATEEQILAAMDEQDPPTPEPETPKPEGDDDEEPETPDTPAAQSATVDAEALAQLQRDAALGREAREQQVSAERDAFVVDRIRKGCITASSKTAHLAELSKGGEIEKAHRVYLSGLTEGVIPVDELGAAATDETSEQATHASIMNAAYGIDVAAGKERS